MLLTPALRGITLAPGGSAASFASYLAPVGYRWEFVTFNGERLTLAGEPVVHLVRAD